MKAIDGREIKEGMKVRGFGKLRFQDGWSIDRGLIMTVRKKGERLFAGALSLESFSPTGIEIIEPKTDR